MNACVFESIVFALQRLAYLIINSKALETWHLHPYHAVCVSVHLFLCVCILRIFLSCIILFMKSSTLIFGQIILVYIFFLWYDPRCCYFERTIQAKHIYEYCERDRRVKDMDERRRHEPHFGNRWATPCATFNLCDCICDKNRRKEDENVRERMRARSKCHTLCLFIFYY